MIGAHLFQLFENGGGEGDFFARRIFHLDDARRAEGDDAIVGDGSDSVFKGVAICADVGDADGGSQFLRKDDRGPKDTFDLCEDGTTDGSGAQIPAADGKTEAHRQEELRAKNAEVIKV